MTRVRFSPSPTGSPDVGSALGAVVPALHGAHDVASTVADPPSDRLLLEDGDRATLVRFRELRAGAGAGLDAPAAKAILRELKAVGGNLRVVRRALTGRGSGPELWAVLAALPREETLRRVDAAL